MLQRQIQVPFNVGEVDLVSPARRLLDPGGHGMFVAQVSLTDERDEHILVSELAEQFECPIEQFPMRLRPQRHLVLHGHGLRRLDEADVCGEIL